MRGLAWFIASIELLELEIEDLPTEPEKSNRNCDNIIFTSLIRLKVKLLILEGFNLT